MQEFRNACWSREMKERSRKERDQIQAEQVPTGLAQYTASGNPKEKNTVIAMQQLRMMLRIE